ncbi:ankyrin repeat-containing domain protein [Tricladium varicosporioides]|nr:ankyrin repeat-containing domain protein [Hymenoscyphus varicosporioides]
MALLDLPNEVLLQIASNLNTQCDRNSVTQLNHHCHSLFKDELIKYNIQSYGSYGLLWATKHDRISTVQRFIELGADTNVQIQDYMRLPRVKTTPSIPIAAIGSTPLHIAVDRRNLDIARILVAAGASAEKRDLINPHYTLYQRQGLTSLHLACKFGLSEFVSLFLEAGTDVNVRDFKAQTPLHHALRGKNDTFEDCDGMFRFVPEKNDFVATVELLLGAGADPDAIVDRWPRQRRSTPRHLAALHNDRRIRALFRTE